MDTTPSLKKWHKIVQQKFNIVQNKAKLQKLHTKKLLKIACKTQNL